MEKLDLGVDEQDEKQWAELRSPESIPRRQARAFRKVLYKMAAPAAEGGVDLEPGQEPTKEQATAMGKAMMASEGGMDGFEDMAEAMVLAVVSSWSFGEVTSEVLETIPDSAVDKIYAKCSDDGYIDKLMPSFSGSADEDSPTTRS